MDWQVLIQQYGYILLFIILLIEGQPVIILVGWLVYLGYLDIWPALIFGLLGYIGGDWLFHKLAYRGGKKFLDKYDKFLFLKRDQLEKINKFFEKYGGKVIFFGKFVYGLGRNVMIVAGLSGRRYRDLYKFDVLGCLASFVFFGVLGYLFGHSYELLEKYIKGYGLIIIAVILVILVLERFGLRKFISNFFNNAK